MITKIAKKKKKKKKKRLRIMMSIDSLRPTFSTTLSPIAKVGYSN